jgi:drug/metabolite transporter (DMT)-like permease
LWAALWGFLFFAEVPSVATLVGAVLIVASGAYAMTRAAASPERAQPSIS